MSLASGETSSSLPQFTTDQWATAQEYLLVQALEAEAIRTSLVPEVEGLYSRLSGANPRIMSMKERAEHTAAEDRYWELHGRLQQLFGHESTLLDVLERIERGEATEAEVLPLLPPEEPEEEERLSKRRAAIRRQQERFGRSEAEMECTAMLLGALGIEPDIVQSSTVFRADATRMATGHNKKRLKAGAGIDPAEAHGTFIETTRDSHGGKVRKHSNASKFYGTAAGRTIRKY